MEWEWRRVKRSFNSKERKSLIDDLQYWNSALKNSFEKLEIPSDDSDPIVQELQARFNPKHCDFIREHARAIHRALEAGWNCACLPPHRATLDLDWHYDRPVVPAVFNLTLSFRKSLSSQDPPGQECWQRIWIKVDDDGAQQTAPALLTPALVSQSIRATPPSKIPTWAKWPRLLGSPHQSQPSRPVTPPPPSKCLHHIS